MSVNKQSTSHKVSQSIYQSGKKKRKKGEFKKNRHSPIELESNKDADIIVSAFTNHLIEAIHLPNLIINHDNNIIVVIEENYYMKPKFKSRDRLYATIMFDNYTLLRLMTLDFVKNPTAELVIYHNDVRVLLSKKISQIHSKRLGKVHNIDLIEPFAMSRIASLIKECYV